MTAAAWAGRVLYHFHSLGAAGAPPANDVVDALGPAGQGFDRLRPWLEHVAALGCGGVLLTPVFVSSTHGYDTADPYRIDQRLGDERDFVAFADECHARDLKLVLDGVFNHTGRAFGPFRDVLAHGRDSSYTEWFRLDFNRDDGDGFAYRMFEGHRDLVALNHDNDAVLAWAADVASFWLDRGADGWRFDAAYAIARPFLAQLTAAIRARHPDAFLFGEMIHGDYARFVRDSGLDAVTQYELHKAIWSSLNDANCFELAWALQRHPTFANGYAPVTFVGNHDVTRIASLLRDPEHLALALGVLFTLPGIPCVYYGDEFAWLGVKEHRAGGDDAIRPPVPERPEPDDAAQAAVLDVHHELIAMRAQHPWLTDARLDVVRRANHAITYTVTGASDVASVTLDVTGGTAPPPDGWHIVVSRPGLTIHTRSRAVL